MNYALEHFILNLREAMDRCKESVMPEPPEALAEGLYRLKLKNGDLFVFEAQNMALARSIGYLIETFNKGN